MWYRSELSPPSSNQRFKTTLYNLASRNLENSKTLRFLFCALQNRCDFSAMFWRFLCDFCGKTSDFALCGCKRCDFSVIVSFRDTKLCRPSEHRFNIEFPLRATGAQISNSSSRSKASFQDAQGVQAKGAETSGASPFALTLQHSPFFFSPCLSCTLFPL